MGRTKSIFETIAKIVTINETLRDVKNELKDIVTEIRALDKRVTKLETYFEIAKEFRMKNTLEKK